MHSDPTNLAESLWRRKQLESIAGVISQKAGAKEVVHGKNHSYDMSLWIIILILCINLSLLQCLSTSEFIWTRNMWDRDSPISQTRNEKTDKQNDFSNVPRSICLVSWGRWAFPPSFTCETTSGVQHIQFGAPKSKGHMDTLEQSESRGGWAGWLCGWSTGWRRRGWESQSCKPGEGRVNRGFLALPTDIY